MRDALGYHNSNRRQNRRAVPFEVDDLPVHATHSGAHFQIKSRGVAFEQALKRGSTEPPLQSARAQFVMDYSDGMSSCLLSLTVTYLFKRKGPGTA